MVSNDMDWDKLRMEFGEIPDKAIVLSEVLTRDELFELYRLFEKEKVIRDFNRIMRDVIRHPMLFFKKLPRVVRRRYILRIIAIFYRRIKLGVLSFRSENENSK